MGDRKLVLLLVLVLILNISMAAAPAACDLARFIDAFTVGANTLLSSHTPNTGTSWTLASSTGGATATDNAASDAVLFSNTNNNYALYTTDAITRNEYNVSMTVSTIDTLDDTAILLGRYTDTNNVYVVTLSGTASECHLRVRSGGTITTLVTPATGVANGDIITFVITNSSKTVYKNGVSWMTSANNAVTAAGRAGLGCGDFTGAGTEDCTNTWRLDNFNVTYVPVCTDACCNGGETYSTCPGDCCDSDCTATTDTTCHSACNGFASCTGFVTGCDGVALNNLACYNATYTRTCCKTLTACTGGQYCTGSACTACSTTCDGVCQSSGCFGTDPDCDSIGGLQSCCGNGACDGSETTSNCASDCCQSDCTSTTDTTCHSSCNGINGCTGFVTGCDGVALNNLACYNSTYTRTCCTTLTACTGGQFCSGGVCGSCSSVCDGVCQNSACFGTDPDCDVSGGATVQCCGNGACGGSETYSNCAADCCDSDCTATTDTTCHSACNGFASCTGFVTGCDGVALNNLACYNATYTRTCCKTLTACTGGQYCTGSACTACSTTCDGVCQSSGCFGTDPDCDVSGGATVQCCGNGACGGSETTSNCASDCCQADCTSTTDTTCHSACNGINGCTGFVTGCDGVALNNLACYNATYTRTCCKTLTACTGGQYCSGGTCGSCSSVCDGVCQSSACYLTDPDCDISGGATVQCCGNSNCGGSETYSNCATDCCEADCSSTTDSTCHSECNTYNGCANFVTGCNGIAVGNTACYNTTYTRTCCETLTNCGAGNYCTLGSCSACSSTCDGVCQSAGCYGIDPDCDVSGGATVQCCGNGACGGSETYSNCAADCCEADCTATTDSLCHSECNTYNGCSNFVTGCDSVSVNNLACYNTTYYRTCCESLVSCGASNYCTGGSCLSCSSVCDGSCTSAACYSIDPDCNSIGGLQSCCGNSACDGSETYSNCAGDCCEADCSSTTDNTCHSECNNYNGCANFVTGCNGLTVSNLACYNATYTRTCCKTLTACTGGQFCSGGICGACSSVCDGACSSAACYGTDPDCDVSGGATVQCCGNGACGGSETYTNCQADCCESDCSSTTDSTCHSECNNYNGCINFATGCNGLAVGNTACYNVTYIRACCKSLTACVSGEYCSGSACNTCSTSCDNLCASAGCFGTDPDCDVSGGATVQCCGNGACGGSETYSTCANDCCQSDCSSTTDSVCHLECNNFNGCANFITNCNNQAVNYLECYNATFVSNCCASVSACGSGLFCNSGVCGACSSVCDGVCSSAACYGTDPDCDVSGGATNQCCGNSNCGGTETYTNCQADCCDNDCSSTTDSTCHSECNGYNGCTGALNSCNGLTYGNLGCFNATYTQTCCNALTACGASQYCFGGSCSVCSSSCDGVCPSSACYSIDPDCTVLGNLTACCGNNLCEGSASESCFNCLNDCGSCSLIHGLCGNGICEVNYNTTYSETCSNCVTDCGGCEAPACNSVNCFGSCGTCKRNQCSSSTCVCRYTSDCCGNTICETGETFVNCDSDCFPSVINLTLISPSSGQLFMRGEKVLFNVNVTYDGGVPGLRANVKLNSSLGVIDLIEKDAGLYEGEINIPSNTSIGQLMTEVNALKGNLSLSMLRAVVVSDVLNVFILTDKSTYIKNERIRINGNVTNARSEPVNASLIVLINGDDYSINAINGVYNFSYLTNILEPTGNWNITVNATDAFNNTGNHTTHVNLLQPAEGTYYSLNVLSPVYGPLERGQVINISVDLSLGGKPVSNAIVEFKKLDGSYGRLEELIVGRYTGTYKLSNDASLGKWIFEVTASKPPFIGVGTVKLIVNPTVINIKLISPPSNSVSVGENVNIQIEASYPDGSPVELPEINVSIGNDTLMLKRISSGVYASNYVVGENINSLSLKLLVNDSSSNTGFESATLSVSGYSASYYFGKYGYIIYPLIAGCVAGAVGLVLALSRLNMLSKLNSSKKRLIDLKKGAQESYYVKHSINKEHYDNLLSKYNNKLQDLDYKIKKLSSRKLKSKK